MVPRDVWYKNEGWKMRLLDKQRNFQIIVLLIIVKERGLPSRRQAITIIKDTDRGGKWRLLFSKQLFTPISNSLTKRPMNWKYDEIPKRKEAEDHLQISRTFLIEYLNRFLPPMPHTFSPPSEGTHLQELNKHPSSHHGFWLLPISNTKWKTGTFEWCLV